MMLRFRCLNGCTAAVRAHAIAVVCENIGGLWQVVTFNNVIFAVSKDTALQLIDSITEPAEVGDED